MTNWQWAFSLTLGVLLWVAAKRKYKHANYGRLYGSNWLVACLILPWWAVVILYCCAQFCWPRIPESADHLEFLDLAMARADLPKGPVMPMALCVIEGMFERNKFFALVKSRVGAIKRMNQTLRKHRESFFWERCVVHLDQHISVSRLSSGSKSELEALLSRIRSKPTDFSKPLWEIHVIENINLVECGFSSSRGSPPVSGWAFSLRCHHCVADGIAFASILVSMMTDKPDTGLEVKEAAHWATEMANRIANKISSGNALKLFLASFFAFWRQGMTPADPDGIFRPALPNITGECRVAWCDLGTLDDYKATAHALNASFNSLILSCICCALQEQYPNKTAMPPSIHMAVSPNMRLPTANSLIVGNQFGTVALKLPLGSGSAEEVLKTVHRNFDHKKVMSELISGTVIWKIVGFLPRCVLPSLHKTISTKASLAYASIPGPAKQMYVLGNPVRAVIGLNPTVGYVSSTFAVTSFSNHVWISFAADTATVVDPHNVTGAVARNLDYFKQLAGKT
ncbi:wax ester/triacylglycerol synthase family O-acyltransferase [Pelomyxa schiedti]|nr:wax ester/triacylglycerol synthase family O-acyltransferase [Pelomyxa schiedti]